MPLSTDGGKLRDLREAKALSLTEFAKEAGYSTNWVSQIELGKSHGGPRFLRTAARILNCQIGDITAGPRLGNGHETGR
jgi:transcriptional regulator with XRE-family HTH domain